ncbi:MAG: hypothetical protein MJB57_14940 [Gemmatimonadetes bacterium]|nr:hypothetical protein [Gemmatimonadota bacterium]
MPPQETRGRGRGVYVAVALYYIALFVALIWPVYGRFATIEPRILSMPFSLAYVVIALLLSFVGLLALYLWEARSSGEPDRDEGSAT